jgi:hypothetical protein
MLLGLVSSLTKRHLPPFTPLKAIGLVVCVLIAVGTYNVKSRWSEFEPEFSRYSRRTAVLESVLTAVVLGLLVAAMIVVGIQARKV